MFSTFIFVGKSERSVTN